MTALLKTRWPRVDDELAAADGDGEADGDDADGTDGDGDASDGDTADG
jgi:hypothetical protein